LVEVGLAAAEGVEFCAVGEEFGDRPAGAPRVDGSIAGGGSAEAMRSVTRGLMVNLPRHGEEFDRVG